MCATESGARARVWTSQRRRGGHRSGRTRWGCRRPFGIRCPTESSRLVPNYLQAPPNDDLEWGGCCPVHGGSTHRTGGSGGWASQLPAPASDQLPPTPQFWPTPQRQSADCVVWPPGPVPTACRMPSESQRVCDSARASQFRPNGGCWTGEAVDIRRAVGAGMGIENAAPHRAPHRAQPSPPAYPTDT